MTFLVVVAFRPQSSVALVAKCDLARGLALLDGSCGQFLASVLLDIGVVISQDSLTDPPMHRYWSSNDLWGVVRAAGAVEFWDASLAD